MNHPTNLNRFKLFFRCSLSELRLKISINGHLTGVTAIYNSSDLNGYIIRGKKLNIILRLGYIKKQGCKKKKESM